MELSPRIITWIEAAVGHRITRDNSAAVELALEHLARENDMAVNRYEAGLLAGTLPAMPFIDRITTQESYFLRHGPAMATVAGLAPNLIREHGELRVLSLPCARGEEAFSFAMILSRRLPGLDRVRIMGGDVSAAAVRAASRAEYGPNALRKADPAFIRDHFDRVSPERFRVRPSFRACTGFRQANVLDPYPFPGGFHMIFCQNLLIYFSTACRIRALENLAAMLHPEGCLVVDPTEASFLLAREAAHPFFPHPDGDTMLFRLAPQKKSPPAVEEQIPDPAVAPPPEPVPPPPPPAVSLLARAQQAARDRELDAAVALFTRSARLEPDTAVLALYGKTLALADKGERMATLETGDACLARNNDTQQLSPDQAAGIHQVLALILERIGPGDLALKHRQKSRKERL
ncbi:MAG: hypothetical protein MI862_01305 [Desulfobacterales bacterium]|nr:hypothetical protein [Desulfobacterales bacterium]